MNGFPENDAVLAPDPIVFRVPWGKRYDHLRALVREAMEHPFVPGYFIGEFKVKKVEGASILIVRNLESPENNLYDGVAEITVYFRKIRFTMEPSE